MSSTGAETVAAAGRPENGHCSVVFDAYWWESGPTSLRHVLRELVFAWHRTFPEDRLVVVVRSKDASQARRSIPGDVTMRTSRWRPQALLARSATERVRREVAADVILTQNFSARSRAMSTVYLHDVLFESDPSWFTLLERAYFSLMVRWSGDADVVFTSSVSEAERIRAHTRARDVVPVGLGISRELVDAETRSPVEGLRAHQFLLTVGRINVRKNLLRTIEAALAAGVSPAAPLVVVGAGDDRELASLPRIASAVQSGAVRFTGHVDDSQLRWLYANTRLFLFLSLGEGFGMPPVEAAYFGAPLIVSDLPVFRENVPHARFVDPSDVDRIAAAISDRSASRPAPGPLEVRAMHDWAETVAAMRARIVRGLGKVEGSARF